MSKNNRKRRQNNNSISEGAEENEDGQPEEVKIEIEENLEVEMGYSEKPLLLELAELERPASLEDKEQLIASKEWRFEITLPEINAILERGQFGELKLVPWGSNYTFIASLEDEKTQANYAVIYKPRVGEAPLWDFPNGTLYKREYAAYLVSKALGWHFIPPVVIRDGPYGTGTVQLFVDAYENIQYYQFRETHAHELKRIAIFDLLSNNADRKAGHCLLGTNGFIWAIDHGLCFNQVPKLRTIIWDYSGEGLPDDICNDLMEFATDPLAPTILRTQLNELLEKKEVDLFFRRLQQVLEKPVFPGLASRRQIPWGMW